MNQRRVNDYDDRIMFARCTIEFLINLQHIQKIQLIAGIKLRNSSKQCRSEDGKYYRAPSRRKFRINYQEIICQNASRPQTAHSSSSMKSGVGPVELV